MPGSDYSRHWNEARDGDDIDEFMEELEEEVEERDSIQERLESMINKLKDNDS